MRGQRKKMNQQLRMGRTIVAEREQAESESERMNARRKAHRKKVTSVVIILLFLLVMGLIVYLGIKELATMSQPVVEGKVEKTIQAEVVDEENRGQISSRMREYIVALESDLVDLGYVAKKIVIPTNTSRELYVDLEGREGYFKVSIDRDPAMTAEDMVRMMRYLDGRDLHPQYVDVRLEGKAYYK